MSGQTWRTIIAIVLAVVMLVAGGFAAFMAYTFELGEGTILAAVATLGFVYTIIKPITDDVDKLTTKKKKLKVCSIYSNNESNFANDINTQIESLDAAGHSIVEISVLSTKRAVIQYHEKEE